MRYSSAACALLHKIQGQVLLRFSGVSLLSVSSCWAWVPSLLLFLTQFRPRGVGKALTDLLIAEWVSPWMAAHLTLDGATTKSARWDSS